jgi:hypothetical protein
MRGATADKLSWFSSLPLGLQPSSTCSSFTINSPEPIVTTGIRLRVKTTNARTVSIFEIEAN